METIDMDVKWYQIGKTAEDFGITVNRLRGWCDNELVEFKTDEHNTRFIPDSEYPKIKRIVELTAKKKEYPTLKHVREQLKKEDLFHMHQAEIQEKQEVEKTSKIMEQAFEKMEFGETFLQMAEGYTHMRQEVSELRNIIENQNNQKLLESEESKKELQALKEQNTQIIDSMKTIMDENTALKGLVQDLLKQDVGTMTKDDAAEILKAVKEVASVNQQNEDKLHLLESKVETGASKQENKGFFSRFFK
ncbi:hypothetical protein ACFY5J_28710 [Peribacillus butanolivorans]|uniref:hypothetical protein n=1 Tax=Peribacillus butanolivorans TaxID=421767 RepID=UPI0036A7FF00